MSIISVGMDATPAGMPNGRNSGDRKSLNNRLFLALSEVAKSFRLDISSCLYFQRWPSLVYE